MRLFYFYTCITIILAVRFFSEQHEMELQHAPKVVTVANLVKMVRIYLCILHDTL